MQNPLLQKNLQLISFMMKVAQTKLFKDIHSFLFKKTRHAFGSHKQQFLPCRPKEGSYLGPR